MAPFLKIALRNLVRRKVYAFINVFGLSIGLAGCGLIGLYIFDEWRVDRFHAKGHRLYRITTGVESTAGDGGVNATVGRPLAATIAAEVPEVEKVIPVRRANFSVKHDGQYYFEKMLYGGEAFLEAFTFPLKEGNPATALRDPYTLVLTESAAQKYFPGGPALGKTLMLNDTLAFRVTGVLADPPPSHLEFAVLLSLPTFKALGGDATQWFTWDEFCYVLLPERADPARAERTISALSMRHNGKQYRAYGYRVSHALEPVSSIYLHSEAGGLNRPTGSAGQLYLLGAIGLFILLLAIINFVNLTTARQADRAKEVDIRKTIGAAYQSLVAQFIGESMLLVALAGGLALLAVALLLPLLNDLTEKTLTLALLTHPAAVGLGLAFLGCTGLLAGWYPALVLARFRPAHTLKGYVTPGGRGAWLRKGLVVFQFCISLVLITGTVMAVRQLRYMQHQKLGFNKDRVLVINLRKTPGKTLYENREGIKQGLQALAPVASVTAAGLPGRGGWEGQLVRPEGRPPEQALTMEVIPVDHDYVKTLGLTIRAGRDYSESFTADAKGGVLLNEAACRAFGWVPEEAIGKGISTSGMEAGRVVGVVADYHQHGLRQKIEPVLTFIGPYFGYYALKLRPGDATAGVAAVERFWKERFPGYPFEYFFLDEDYDQQYKAETRLARLFGVFSALAIVIACLGLFGLAAFLA
ncbi:MAG TPA: ABC transporter permease, partial [Cytophagales bacterium]